MCIYQGPWHRNAEQFQVQGIWDDLIQTFCSQEGLLKKPDQVVQGSVQSDSPWEEYEWQGSTAAAAL